MSCSFYYQLLKNNNLYPVVLVLKSVSRSQVVLVLSVKRSSSLRSLSSSSQLLPHQRYFHHRYRGDLGPRHHPRLCRQRFEDLHFMS